ncbi:hypothetical protein H5410_027683 [Solanum commersonii]|uniref:Uncharacterized protein n=1 Tax=Solanum commersonii TaxID=4109 RepID=A0A9J5Z2R2_SOLCO|nr:hypothetical protein H5410_027683 [Solanum commersonii]
MYDKYCSLDNVENPHMSMPQVGTHGRMKHKLGLDSSNKCKFVIGHGSDDGIELQDHRRALPRPVVDKGQSIAELVKGFVGRYHY